MPKENHIPWWYSLKMQIWRVMLHPTSVPSKTLRGCFSCSVPWFEKNIQNTKNIFINMLIMDTGMFIKSKLKKSITTKYSWEPQKSTLFVLSFWKVPVIYASCSLDPPSEKGNNSLRESSLCKRMGQRISKKTCYYILLKNL